MIGHLGSFYCVPFAFTFLSTENSKLQLFEAEEVVCFSQRSKYLKLSAFGKAGLSSFICREPVTTKEAGVVSETMPKTP